MPGRARLGRHHDDGRQRAGRRVPRRAAAPLPEQAGPRRRRGRAPDRAPSRGHGRRGRRPARERPHPRRARRARRQFVSPVFFAALELWVAARTDAELRAAVGPLERRVGRETHAYALELLGVDESRGDNRELVQATLDLLRGLGLAASLSDDSKRRGAVLDAWAAVLDDGWSWTTPRRRHERPPHLRHRRSRRRERPARRLGRAARRPDLASGPGSPPRRAGRSPTRSPTSTGPTRPRSRRSPTSRPSTRG